MIAAGAHTTSSSRTAGSVMGGYLIFGAILAAFAAPPIAAGRLYDEAKRLDREEQQNRQHSPSAAPVMVVALPADTSEAQRRRRQVGIRLAAEWQAAHGRKS